MTMPALPARPGSPPETGPAIPHVQFTQTSPPQVREQTIRLLAALPGTRTGPSEISEPGSFAVFTGHPAAGAVLLPPRRTAEFAHVHADGSLHLALDPADQAELLAKGWGERHPLYSPGVNVVMLYAPRDATDLQVTRTVLDAAYRYATGRQPAGGLPGQAGSLASSR